MNGLTVVIPSRNPVNLMACLKAVNANDPAARLMVIDDGIADSPDWNTIPVRHFSDPIPEDEKFLSLQDPSRWIQGVKPFVYARNCNLGIKAAGTDDILLLNDDALLCSPGGFSLMQQQAYAHPLYGIISATCNNVGNVNQHPTGQHYPEDLVRPMLRSEPRMICFVATLIPRRTIDSVGLLCEEFVGYGFEDDDYCARVRKAGLKIGIFEGCFVDHSRLKSTFRGERYPVAGFRHNEQIYQRKVASGEYNQANNISYPPLSVYDPRRN